MKMKSPSPASAAAHAGEKCVFVPSFVYFWYCVRFFFCLPIRLHCLATIQPSKALFLIHFPFLCVAGSRERSSCLFEKWKRHASDSVIASSTASISSSSSNKDYTVLPFAVVQWLFCFRVRVQWEWRKRLFG